MIGAPTQELKMKTTYVLIDYENVQVKSLALLKGDHFRVVVFLGPKNTKIGADLAMAMQALGSKAEYIKLDASGHNALDFHITYCLGKLAALDANNTFCIISKDTGFDSLIKYVKKNNINCSRAVSIEAMLGVKVPPVEKVVPKEPAVVKAPVVDAPVVVKAKAVTKKAKPIPAKLKADEWTAKIVTHLTKLVTSQPRTQKALLGKIKNWCGTQYSEKEVEAIFKRLVAKGIVTVEGTKVSYQLPEEPSVTT